MFRKLTAALAIPAAAAAITLASTAASAAVVGVHTSKVLAGYSLQGNGGNRFRDLRAQVTVPDESAASPAVPADSVVVGLTQASSVNGGYENGIGLVWDNTASGCAANQWVLEAGQGNLGVVPEPLPTGDLSPLLDGGVPVCVNGGGSEWVEVYYNASSHFVHFVAGPTQGLADTLSDVPDGGYHNFYSGGWGVDTTSAAGTENLINGLVGSLGSVGVTQYNGHRHTATAFNLAQWIGTQSGGPASVSNPTTLTPSAIGSGFGVSAP